MRILNFKSWLLWLSIIGCFASSCKVENIQYKRIENLSFTGISNNPGINLDMIYFNPNKVGCRISKMGCFIISGNDTLADVSGRMQSVKLKPQSDFSVPVSSTLNAPAMMQLASRGFLNGGDIPVRISGSVTIRKFIFSKKYQFAATEKFNSRQLFKLR